MFAAFFCVIIGLALWFIAVSTRKIIGTLVTIIAFANPFSVMCWVLAILAAVGIWASVG